MITVQQAANRLKVSTRTVLRWIGLGKLEAIKQGTRWQVNESTLEALMADRNCGCGINKSIEAKSLPGKSGSSLLPGEEEFISWISREKQEKDKRQP